MQQTLGGCVDHVWMIKEEITFHATRHCNNGANQRDYQPTMKKKILAISTAMLIKRNSKLKYCP